MNYNNNGYYGGNYPPPGGNYPPPPPYNWQYDPLAQEKKREKKNISRISITVGLAVIGFTLLSYGFRRGFCAQYRAFCRNIRATRPSAYILIWYIPFL